LLIAFDRLHDGTLFSVIYEYNSMRPAIGNPIENDFQLGRRV
jgi:hypothetical protein